MKFLIISLFATIVGGSVLRGGPAEETPVSLSPPDVSCLGTDDIDECEGRLSSDGRNNCVWCESEGVCLSKTNVMDMAHIMGVSCSEYNNMRQIDIFLDMVDVNVDAPSAMGLPTPPDFNCLRSAWDGVNARVTCGGSRASDDSPCVWCSAGSDDDDDDDDDDDVAGACLSNDEAMAINGKYGLACPSVDYLSPLEDVVRDGIPDVNCLKAAWVAENAETACDASKDSSGNDCVWCKTEGDVAGVCLSVSESSMADGQFGLTCPRGELLRRKSFTNFMAMLH
jgi:hypothetical protein